MSNERPTAISSNSWRSIRSIKSFRPRLFEPLPAKASAISLTLIVAAQVTF
jgi:hypothetical protein